MSGTRDPSGHPARIGRRARHLAAGFTLLEVLTACTLLAIGITSALFLSRQTTRMSADLPLRLQARQVARELLSEIRSGADVEGPGATSTIRWQVRRYDVEASLAQRALAARPSTLDAAATEPTLQRIEIALSWEEHGRTVTDEYETLIVRPR